MDIMTLVSDLVATQASSRVMTPDEITESIEKIYKALKWIQLQEDQNDSSTEASDLSGPDSIQRTRVVCLECGKAYRQLTERHLARHGLDPSRYKTKYGIPLKQGLCAKNLSSKRRRIAKDKGLGERLQAAKNIQKK